MLDNALYLICLKLTYLKCHLYVSSSPTIALLIAPLSIITAVTGCQCTVVAPPLSHGFVRICQLSQFRFCSECNSERLSNKLNPRCAMLLYIYISLDRKEVHCLDIFFYLEEWHNFQRLQFLTGLITEQEERRRMKLVIRHGSWIRPWG